MNTVTDTHHLLWECRNVETSVGPWKTFTTLRALLVRTILAITHTVHGGNHYHQNIDWWFSSPKMKHAIPNQPQPNYSGKVQNVMTGDDITHLMWCNLVHLCRTLLFWKLQRDGLYYTTGPAKQQCIQLICFSCIIGR